MKNIFALIFKPNDGSRERVKGEVVLSRERVELAANKIEETVRALLDQNDKLTGRNGNHAIKIPPAK